MLGVGASDAVKVKSQLADLNADEAELSVEAYQV